MNIVLGITGSVAAVLTEKMCASLLSAGHAIRVWQLILPCTS